MLSVDQFELIRRKYFVDGMSQRAIAQELGHSRKTVKKAISHSTPPAFQKPDNRKKPTIDPVSSIIDAWLEEDRQRPRKQRHTAYRIFERLRDEHGYQGHSSTIRRYVGQKKKEQTKEVFFPLQFDPGEEAQVDWGEAVIFENGKQRKVQIFCIRLCHSKVSFVRAYDRANLESFLDGHVHAFEFFGGIPRRLAYDNLRSAVAFSGKGSKKTRKLNPTFKEMRSWYLFDTRFCNVARGNEKGAVENLVKRAQRSFLTPVPEVTSLEELNQHLLKCCQREQAMLDSQSWNAEQKAFLPLSENPFPACRQHKTKVDKFSIVQFDSHFYSTPVCWAHKDCEVRGFVDRIEIYCNHTLVASHSRCHESCQTFVLDPLHYVELLQKKPGALDQARPFKGDGFGKDFELLRKELEYRYHDHGTRQFIRILQLFGEHPEEDVRCAVAECVRLRAFSEDAIIHLLRNGTPVESTTTQLDLTHRPDLAEMDNGIRSSHIYNQLLQEEAAA